MRVFPASFFGALFVLNRSNLRCSDAFRVSGLTVGNLMRTERLAQTVKPLVHLRKVLSSFAYFLF